MIVSSQNAKLLNKTKILTLRKKILEDNKMSLRVTADDGNIGGFVLSLFKFSFFERI